MNLTTLEASEKYGISMTHLRLLLAKGTIKGRQARLTAAKVIWLIDEKSLLKFCKKRPKRGPKPK